MQKLRENNEVVLDGYKSDMDLPRGIKIEDITGEFSMMVFEQDAILEKYNLNKKDFPLTEV